MASHQPVLLAMAVTLALGVSGVGVADAQPGAAPSPALRRPPTSAPSETKTNNELRAAAEPFEMLTETSFSAALPKLDQTIRKAEKEAGRVRGLLSNDGTRQLDAQLSALRSAGQRQDRAAVALSSIEVYRIFVSAVTSASTVPTEVSLLDYAGFRYRADLKANPIRWGDMANAVSFANEKWTELLPKVNSIHLAKAVGAALSNMAAAVAQRSEPLASSSARAELELVDQLEQFFSAGRAPTAARNRSRGRPFALA